jgi:CcmD family protein
MDSLSYLIAALAVTIIGILVYVYYLGQRTRELRRDLAAIEQAKHPGHR